MKTAAVLLAAGRGERFGAKAGVNKLYVDLGGRPVLMHALLRLVRSPLIEKVVVVVRPGDEALFEREVLRRLSPKQEKLLVVPGGRERQDSARAGVEALAQEEPELVLIHDGARPFFSEELLERLIEAAREHGAAVPALPVEETIRLGDEEGFAAGELERERLYRVQTPQCFRYGLLRQALAAAHEQGRYFTDDAGAVALLGHKIKLISGEETNIKITAPLDLKLAELLLKSPNSIP